MFDTVYHGSVILLRLLFQQSKDKLMTSWFYAILPFLFDLFRLLNVLCHRHRQVLRKRSLSRRTIAFSYYCILVSKWHFRERKKCQLSDKFKRKNNVEFQSWQYLNLFLNKTRKFRKSMNSFGRTKKKQTVACAEFQFMWIWSIMICNSQRYSPYPLNHIHLPQSHLTLSISQSHQKQISGLDVTFKR